MPITTDMFAFDLYDKDSSGELSASEVARMLQDIYGKKEVKSNFLAKRYEKVWLSHGSKEPLVFLYLRNNTNGMGSFVFLKENRIS